MVPDQPRTLVDEGPVVTDDTVMVVGGFLAIVGGTLGVIVNVVAPRVRADYLGAPAELSALAARTPGWELIQAATVLGLLLVLPGFYAVAKSIEDAPAKTGARLGLGIAIIGTIIGVAVFTINSFVAQGGDTLGSGIANGESFIGGGGLFNIWTLVYFGLVPGLYGIALTGSSRYPTWLGWVTILASPTGLSAGFIGILEGATKSTVYILFPISSGVLTLVVIYLGFHLISRPIVPST